MAVFAAIDFETADYRPDSACAVAAVLVRDDRIADRFCQRIRPPRPGFVFTYIHGITWDDVANSPTFCQMWPHLAAFLRRAEFLAAHNAPFDRGVLRACCEAASVPAPRKRFVCTVRLARATWGLTRANLPAVCRHLGIPLNHHDALSDAEACARIAIEAVRAGAAL
jgi:DNA polymerase-3 subunit epsilon